jgi:RsiW-degrading membrane proteinase PrsW (M82 family)
MYLLALSVAPALAICIFIYWKDKFEKEPKKLLVLSFFLGIVSLIPVLFLEIAAMKFGLNAKGNIIQTAIYSFFGIGLIEEGCKYFFIRIGPYRSKAFNEPFDGITYSVMVSMGFAAVENIAYVMDGGYKTAIFRILTAVPAHATFGIIVGYYLGLQKIKGIKSIGIKGLLFASTLHAAYDFFIFISYIPGMWVGALLSLYFGLRFSFKAINIHQQASPFKI